ncbi:hypothetical protein [Actimicrobium sp. CCI2.3]|uniref:hypothetical protein n=1 Tax=Actimicrobium sp. CCI2.3 TaxID=3048616 RepID=UPI002AB368EF|nr:hypothetical protein [Actimicrobium sp. CCI2.3]MDY7574619.1 hypothetical protein [Actimicrobium sp. CCI2.3]MEB0024152.1 hypothetical protein [Actimicrobium sp. CCI2.3]
MEKYQMEDYSLPNVLKIPQSFLDLITTGLPDIEPWWWLVHHSEALIYWSETLRNHFPSRSLIPFAKDGGSDDIACFDGFDISKNPKVLVIHSFCSPGLELRDEADSFLEWLQKKEKEAIDFKTLKWDDN